MLTIKSVRHRYNGHAWLDFPDWDVRQGEHWLLMGASGSGKTTLLHVITGLLPPAEGKVVLDHTQIYRLSNRELDRFRGRRIGLVLQKPHLIKSLTVAENLLIAQRFAGFPESKTGIRQTLASLGIADKEKQYPARLSQGELQRVSIARAVINHPALLVADEPTSSLDDRNAASVLQLLTGQARQNQAALIIATHDKRVKDRISNVYEL